MTPLSSDLQEILQALEPLHDDNDHHQTCASNYVFCQTCGKRRYILSYLGMAYQCNHTPISVWKSGECDCGVAATMEKATKALIALIQSRERAARIDEHDFIANLLIKSGGSITPRSAGDWLKQELAIHRATLSNNEEDNHERS